MNSILEWAESDCVGKGEGIIDSLGTTQSLYQIGFTQQHVIFSPERTELVQMLNVWSEHGASKEWWSSLWLVRVALHRVKPFYIGGKLVYYKGESWMLWGPRDGSIRRFLSVCVTCVCSLQSFVQVYISWKCVVRVLKPTGHICCMEGYYIHLQYKADHTYRVWRTFSQHLLIAVLGLDCKGSKCVAIPAWLKARASIIFGWLGDRMKSKKDAKPQSKKLHTIVLEKWFSIS